MRTACVKRDHLARGAFQFDGVHVSKDHTRRQPVYSMICTSFMATLLLAQDKRNAASREGVDGI